MNNKNIDYKQIIKTGGSWGVYMKDAFKEIGAKKGDFVKLDIIKEKKQIVLTLQE